MRAVDQQLFRRQRILRAHVVAETICPRFQHAKAVNIRLVLHSIRATRREGHHNTVARRLCRHLDAHTATQHDQICHRHLLGRTVERRLNVAQHTQNMRQLRGLIDRPILLRRKPDARTIGPTAFI